MAWEDVVARLRDPRNFWLVTVNADGSPQAAPVWGTVHRGTFYCFSTPSSLKAKNLVRDDRVVVHLEDGDRVVIVHGRLLDEGAPTASPGVVAAYATKYGAPEDQAYLPHVVPDPGADYVVDALYRLDPDRAIMWTLADFDASQRRWRR